MAEQFITRKGKGWVTGFPEIAVKGIDTAGMQSMEETETCESAHTKDSNGNDALSVYFNRQGSITLTAAYLAGEEPPKAGEELTIKGKSYVLTSVGKSFNNTGTASLCNLTAENRDAWVTTPPQPETTIGE